MHRVEHLKNFFDGISSAVLWGVESRPYVKSADGFRRDQKNLTNDAKRVGKGLKKSLDRHGKQVSQSRG